MARLSPGAADAVRCGSQVYSSPDKTRAPWTPEQVAALNDFQQRGEFHPFTCPTRYDNGTHVVLVAHEDGWHCPACDYRQDWAHDFMAVPRG
jgi:ribosomal protein S27AE